MDSVLATLTAAGDDANLRAAGPADVVAGVQPQAVAEPENAEALARLLARAAAASLAVVPRGGGTKLGWGNAPRAADLVLSTRRLDAVTAHASADLTVTVQAGCTVQKLQQVLARNGQRLALDPAWPEHATVGGILATNDSGSLRGAFGSLRDQVIAITVALADPTTAQGRLASSGGRVVKNVAGYDLPKLFVGALGTLGVITEATFRLYPLPAASRTRVFTFQDVDGAGAFLLALHDSRLRPTGVQLHSGSHAPVEVAVRLEAASEKAIDAQEGQLGMLARAGEVSASAAAPGSGAGASTDGPGSGMPAAAAGSGSGVSAQPMAGDASPDVWRARERLSVEQPAGAAVALGKLTFLPARLPSLLRDVAATGGWELVAQSVGVGWLRLEAPGAEQLAQAILQVRQAAAPRGGSLFLANAPSAVKPSLDAWGHPGDALPLMRRIKEQFDPRACLNPGRFVGGI